MSKTHTRTHFEHQKRRHAFAEHEHGLPIIILFFPPILLILFPAIFFDQRGCCRQSAQSDFKRRQTLQVAVRNLIKIPHGLQIPHPTRAHYIHGSGRLPHPACRNALFIRKCSRPFDKGKSKTDGKILQFPWDDRSQHRRVP